jgi:hypothetical protein
LALVVLALFQQQLEQLMQDQMAGTPLLVFILLAQAAALALRLIARAVAAALPQT